MKKIKFMCTAFRDGFQSVFGARVLSKDYMPAVKATAEAGVTWFEAGGGALFQSPIFYCNESAFDVMDKFREVVGPDANLQTLARGINVVGLDSQSSDIIDLHAKLFKKHGMTTIRNFDALNDPNNLDYSGRCIVNAGLKHEITITMMSLPPGLTGAHDPDFYEARLKSVIDAKIPFDTLCFKDASGTSVPAVVHETIKRARKLVGPDVQIDFHTHETAGGGVACYMAAIEAGADAVDLSMAPVSGGSCHVDIATMWHVLRGSEYTLDIDIEKILKAEEVFKDCMKNYFIPPEAMKVEPTIPWSPMPGGALTANTQMLRDNGLLDKYNDIAKAMHETVSKGGFGTSVTPVSQFYFQQAFNNVIYGPWKKVAEGYGKMVLGYFGKTPAAPDPEIVKIASEQLKLEPTTESPLAINDRNPKKGIKAATELLKTNNLPVSDENIFIAAACGEKGIMFLKGNGKTNIRYKPTEKPSEKTNASGKYKVSVDGTNYDVAVNGDSVVVNGKSYNIGIVSDKTETNAVATAGGSAEKVLAKMPGIVTKISAPAGTSVVQGQAVMIVEVMKMENEIKAPKSGTVKSVAVKQGDQVKTGDVLFEIA